MITKLSYPNVNKLNYSNTPLNKSQACVNLNSLPDTVNFTSGKANLVTVDSLVKSAFDKFKEHSTNKIMSKYIKIAPDNVKVTLINTIANNDLVLILEEGSLELKNKKISMYSLTKGFQDIPSKVTSLITGKSVRDNLDKIQKYVDIL